jgi:hypothetical protein
MKAGRRSSYWSRPTIAVFHGSLILLILLMWLPMNVISKERKTPKQAPDTIEFSGYKWTIKDSNGRQTGPGDNYFSNSKKNVYVDNEGKLHMRITQRDDKWYCPEVRMVHSLGYGRYYFTLDPLQVPLDRDVVIGLFMYDQEDNSNFHNEVDIEISKWGKDTKTNSQYVIQPKEEEAHRFVTDLTIPSRHMIELGRKKITFRSYQLRPEEKDTDRVEIAKHKIKPDKDYETENEKVSMNMWLYHTSEPSDLREFEVVISRFEFKPFWIDKFLRKKHIDRTQQKQEEDESDDIRLKSETRIQGKNRKGAAR